METRLSVRALCCIAALAAFTGCAEQGTQGEAGPKGDKGEQGERGPQGFPGLPGASCQEGERYTRIESADVLAGNGIQLASTCDPGDRLVTGGCALDSSGWLLGSSPEASDDWQGWRCFANAGPSATKLRAFAVCEASE